ncbi:MAG: integral rane protein [Anaerospora sp.]|jgi:integral membrane protein (TIGR00529 family)|nr:integral rane protein [Anaerospora sp.]
MFAVLKVLATLAVIVIALNRKVKMGNAMLAGSAILFILSEPTLAKLANAALRTATSHSTWEILFALYFVMCLEYQFRTGGIIDGLMATARSLLRSDRVLLAMMPAFLGFLPSLGGAIFSAPLVESASKPFSLSAETKTAINYWFRHIWEYTNPIFTGMLLASQISGLSLNALISHMAWLTVLSAVIGWLLLISPLKKNQLSGNTVIISDSGSTSYHFLLLATAPIIANFILVVFLKMPASISMALVVGAMILVLRQSLTDIRAMLLHALDSKLLWGIVGILFFQQVLQQSGAINEIALLLNAISIPATVVIGIIAFVAGLLTGTSQGFVAIAFPFIAVMAPGDLTLAMISFVMGTAGQMLSPAHMCLLVTLDYFHADFLKTLRPVFILNIIMIVAAYASIL